MDIPGNAFLSCGATRAWGNGNYVHARPVSGATQYQFRFRLDAEGFLAVRISSTYFVQLNWLSDPLQSGKTYQVAVRAFKNGAWCVDNGNPTGTAPFVAWGDVCALTIDNTPANSGNQNMAAEQTPLLDPALDHATPQLLVYPNPNRGEQLFITLGGLKDASEPATLDLFDVSGRPVLTRTMPLRDGASTLLDLEGNLSPGTYLLVITVDGQRISERIVVEQ